MEARIAPPPTPLPKEKVAAVCVIVVSQSVCASILFPFVGFMVEDLTENLTREEVGYYAGYLASIYFLVQVFSGYPWGFLADRWGRRPVLLLGLIGSGIAIVLFGFSTTYWLALVYRALSGLVDSTVVTIKAYLGDITDHTNKARGFSYYGMTWGIGFIVGPVVGGLLAQPAIKYPAIFHPDGIFGQFPYALPCLLSGLLSVISLILCWFALPESLPSRNENGNSSGIRNEREKQSAEIAGGDIEMELMPPEHRYQKYQPLEFEEKLEGEEEEQSQQDAEEGVTENSEVQESEEKELAAFSIAKDPLAEEKELFLLDVEQHPLKNEKENEKEKQKEEEEEEPGSVKWEWRWTRRNISLIGTIGAYFMNCLVFGGHEEVFPLWCIADQDKGGLSYSTANIGWLLLGAGVALAIFQAFFYTRITKRLGIRTALIGGLIIGGISVALFPTATIFLSLFAGDQAMIDISVAIYLEILIVIKSCCATCCFTSTNIFVNLSAPRDDVGTANGVAFMVAGISKALGPTVGANILAWSLNNNLAFPLDYHFVFLVLGASSVLGIVATLFIHPSIEGNKKK